MNKKHALLIAGMVTLGTAGTHTFFYGFNLLFTLLMFGVALLAVFSIKFIRSLGKKNHSGARNNKSETPQ
jgi:hypothetical protein